MDEKAVSYLKNSCGMDEEQISSTIKKMKKYPDIYREFQDCVKNGKTEFPRIQPVIEQGYTAERLFNETSLEPVGAYNYLIFLRESPEQALEALKKGLPRR